MRSTIADRSLGYKRLALLAGKDEALGCFPLKVSTFSDLTLG